MWFSRGFRYATRLLIELARLGPEERTPASAAAAAAGLPPAWSGKLVSQMVAAALIDSQRGRHGGIRLSRPSQQIRLAEVAAVLVRDELDHCIAGYPTCEDEGACPAHRQWVALRTELREGILKMSLAELAERPEAGVRSAPGNYPERINDILL